QWGIYFVRTVTPDGRWIGTNPDRNRKHLFCLCSARLIFEKSEISLFPRQMNRIPFILIAYEFEDVRIQQQMHLLRRCGPWFLVCLRIVDRGVEFEVAEIHATKSFGDVKRFGRGMT